MTSNLTPHLTPHLTHEQLCDLILACSPHPLSSDFAALEEHLRACPDCSEELTRLSRSLTLFRDASASFAKQEFAAIHARRAHQTVLPTPHSLVRPLYWATAAVLALAVLAPLGLRHRSATMPSPVAAITTSAHTEESDEALLEEIDQDISASVPSPMRPLADPAASSASKSATSNPDLSKQTKQD